MTVVSDVADDATPAPEPPRDRWNDQPATDQRTDQVAPFRPAILGIRGGTTAVSVALASPAFTEGDLWVVGWCFLIVGYNVFRIVRPVRYVDDTRSLVRVIGEVAFHTIAVAATGYWDSPFIFALITAVMVAGFARGFAFALRVSIAACLAIAIPFLVQDGTTVEDVRTTAQWTVELVLVALIAGYARRVTGEADRAHSLALDRLGRLTALAGETFQLAGDRTDALGQFRDEAEVFLRGLALSTVEECPGIVGIGADGGDRLVDFVGDAGGKEHIEGKLRRDQRRKIGQGDEPARDEDEPAFR